MGNLKNEWEILHADNERYERFSLLIKLVAVVSAIFLMVLSSGVFFPVLMVLLLWGQESIWKTYQARLCDRIMIVEAALKTEGENIPEGYQFYSEWLKNKPSTSGLIKEYAKNGLKPTVMYPYIILLVVLFVFSI